MMVSYWPFVRGIRHWKLNPPLKTECCYNANFVVTDGTWGCRYGNIRRQQWRPRWHHGNSWLWVTAHQGPVMLTFALFFIVSPNEVFKKSVIDWQTPRCPCDVCFIVISTSPFIDVAICTQKWTDILTVRNVKYMALSLEYYKRYRSIPKLLMPWLLSSPYEIGLLNFMT